MLTNFSAEQKNILLSISAGMPLVADIANAHVTIYLRPAEGVNAAEVFCEAEPLTNFVHHHSQKALRTIDLSEEPLIARALQRNIVVEGKREYALGEFANTKIYPLRDMKDKCFAVAVFTTKSEKMKFFDTAMNLLRNYKREVVGNNCYRRLAPIDGLMVVNDEKTITEANKTAQHIFQILGISTLVGKRTNSLDINWPVVNSVLQSGVAEEKDLNIQGILLNVRVIPVIPFKKTPAVIVIFEDITELKKKDEELLIKSVVIKEIHHRVKNNLQTIASLLRLQERRAVSEETQVVLRDCINRVNSIAVVHEFLSQEDSGTIDIAVVASGIYEAIMGSMVTPNLKLKTSFNADNVALSSEKATSIALVLNELLQNSLDHAFDDREVGEISVNFSIKEDCYLLEITDDGTGLPKGFDLSKTKSLGLKIIQTMVESDLKGVFELLPNPKGGTRAIVTIPKGVEE